MVKVTVKDQVALDALILLLTTAPADQLLALTSEQAKFPSVQVFNLDTGTPEIKEFVEQLYSDPDYVKSDLTAVYGLPAKAEEAFKAEHKDNLLVVITAQVIYQFGEAVEIEGYDAGDGNLWGSNLKTIVDVYADVMIKSAETAMAPTTPTTPATAPPAVGSVPKNEAATTEETEPATEQAVVETQPATDLPATVPAQNLPGVITMPVQQVLHLIETQEASNMQLLQLEEGIAKFRATIQHGNSTLFSMMKAHLQAAAAPALEEKTA